MTIDPSTIVVAPISYNVFLGDLHGNATEQEIQDAFSACGQIVEVRIIRDKATGQCKGYGFIHFATDAGRKKCLSPEFSSVVLGGRSIRVKESEQKINLFIGNLPMSSKAEDIEAGILYALSKIASPDSFKVDIKTNGPPENRPRGYGFVTGTSSAVAEAAKTFLAGVVLNGRQINVNWAESPTQADSEASKTSTTLYVANLTQTLEEDVLNTLFSQFGEINKCVIMKHPQTNVSRGYGFVGFTERSMCEEAIAALNEKEFQGKVLQVSIAKTPSNKTKTPAAVPQRGVAAPPYPQAWGAQPNYAGWGQAGAYGGWGQPAAAGASSYYGAAASGYGAYPGYPSTTTTTGAQTAASNTAASSYWQQQSQASYGAYAQPQAGYQPY